MKKFGHNFEAGESKFNEKGEVSAKDKLKDIIERKSSTENVESFNAEQRKQLNTRLNRLASVDYSIREQFSSDAEDSGKILREIGVMFNRVHNFIEFGEKHKYGTFMKDLDEAYINYQKMFLGFIEKKKQKNEGFDFAESSVFNKDGIPKEVRDAVVEAEALIQENCEGEEIKSLKHLIGDKQYTFHNRNHTEGFFNRTIEIGEIMNLDDKDQVILSLVALHHDTFQFRENMKRKGIHNEYASAAKLVATMKKVNADCGEEYFTEADMIIAEKAIVATIATFSFEEGTVVQPAIQRDMLKKKFAEGKGHFPPIKPDDYPDIYEIPENLSEEDKNRLEKLSWAAAVSDINESIQGDAKAEFSPMGDALKLEDDAWIREVLNMSLNSKELERNSGDVSFEDGDIQTSIGLVSEGLSKIKLTKEIFEKMGGPDKVGAVAKLAGFDESDRKEINTAFQKRNKGEDLTEEQDGLMNELYSKLGDLNMQDVLAQVVVNWSAGQIGFLKGRHNVTFGGHKPEYRSLVDDLDELEPGSKGKYEESYLQKSKDNLEFVKQYADRRKEMLEGGKGQELIQDFLTQIYNVQPNTPKSIKDRQ